MTTTTPTTKRRGRPPGREHTRQWRVMVPPELDDAAVAAAKREGVPLAAWVREAVRLMLEKR